MRGKLLLGPFVHVDHSSPNYLLEAAHITKITGGNTFMLYSPVRTLKRDFPLLNDLEDFTSYCHHEHIDYHSLVLHAPFTINLANPINERVWHFSLYFLRQQLLFCDQIGFKYLVLHPGSHLNTSAKQGLDRLIKGLNRLNLGRYKAKIALETMSGKGSELGSRFEDFAYILKQVNHPEKIGVCLDTCHMNDAGYNLHDWEQVKEAMQQSFPLSKVWVIHLNDSQSPQGSHKDRHQNIGYGTIGFSALNHITHDQHLMHATKILETPYYEGQIAPYKAEIKSLLTQRFLDFRHRK